MNLDDRKKNVSQNVIVFWLQRVSCLAGFFFQGKKRRRSCRPHVAPLCLYGLVFNLSRKLFDGLVCLCWYNSYIFFVRKVMYYEAKFRTRHQVFKWNQCVCVEHRHRPLLDTMMERAKLFLPFSMTMQWKRDEIAIFVSLSSKSRRRAISFRRA